ncbi:MAG: DsbA family oxidoreductase [Nitrosopumilaceae archaeon]|nr:DsbA family oxidoreductase [Nitrosopumilaceae archaeon]NIU02539.1 DsbA family oxidoreductase [Nitrosopumilaceae archaeon]NIX63140.1 DsbA family oxidoreductase [Nitrosopumilaceae archaeon]
MEVEIWSDVMCPFCYIGKRRFENALDDFEYNNEIKVTWRSFQLNPEMKTEPEADINEYLAKAKGWSVKQAQQMNQRVTDMAAEEGLEYNMNQAVVANSYDAHRLVQFSKDRGKANEMEEALFKAYFTEGENIADHQTLIDLAEAVGIDPTEAKSILESDKYANAVKHDIQLAQNINITGVPFFLFDRKFAVSGARETEVFLKALKQSWNARIEDQQKAG